MKAHTRKRPARGFTLLELMVVIFIMISMAGIAAASFQGFLKTELIKLAGNQVGSAIRMARQYAMSRRTKVMVEFVEPEYGLKDKLATIDCSHRCLVKGGTDSNDKNPRAPGAVSACTWSYPPPEVFGFDKGNVMTFIRFDLTGVDAASITKAEMIFPNSYSSTNDDRNHPICQVADDTWDMTTLCYDDILADGFPVPGAEITQLFVTDKNPMEYRIDVLSYIQAEYTADGEASFVVKGDAAGNLSTFYIDDAQLYIEYEWDTGATFEETEQAPRQVRILPYLRSYNPATGGFDWLVDQDSAFLKIMDMPPNIHYVLLPAAVFVDQYDPGDSDDQKSTIVKTFFVLQPDGTCDADAPDIEGWESFLTTIILRDTTIGDLALLYIPPTSSFTRQRYLFGEEEVESFTGAHSPLW